MSQAERIILATLQSWNQVISRLNQRLLPLTDEQINRSVAPDRNRVAYLLGHLTVAHDRMRFLLGWAIASIPSWALPFLTILTGPWSQMFPPDLKKAWTDVNQELTAGMSAFSVDEWLQKQAAVSEDDFGEDPSRNRLTILLSRTNHASFHLGQIVLPK